MIAKLNPLNSRGSWQETSPNHSPAHRYAPALFPILSVLLLTLVAASAGAELIINEVNMGDQDWIELYNCSATPLDASGYKLNIRDSGLPGFDFPIPASTILPQGTVVVVAESPLTGEIETGQNIPWFFDRNLSLTLRNGNDDILDFWAHGAALFGAPPGVSFQPAPLALITFNTDATTYQRAAVTSSGSTFYASDWISGPASRGLPNAQQACGCGNNIVSPGEQCDDGNLIDGDGCDSNCTPTGCGNGIVTTGELCDDSNTTPGDGCDATCTTETGWTCPTQGQACQPVCGDGLVRGNEQCDDNNLVDGDGCDGNCTVTGCGNGIVTAGEQCDDGNFDDNDTCKTDCTLNVCGDGAVYTGVEPCDDGNLIDGDGCDSNCTLTGCGNGIVTSGEQCDDGNTASGDGCDASCQLDCHDKCVEGTRLATSCGSCVASICAVDPYCCNNGWDSICVAEVASVCGLSCGTCGDGTLDAGEQCDDGNTDNGDCCSSTCQFEASGSPCQDDGNDCTQNGCDGAGACTHPDEPVNTPCGDPSDTDCTNPDTCDGAGTCLANHEAANTPCTTDGNGCTQDVCDNGGTCTHPNEPVNTPCGDLSDTDCDNPDSCNGAGTCEPNHELANTSCTVDTNDCTQDICDHSGTCTHPPEPANTPCGDSSNTECTDPDACNGAGVCLANNVANGTPCHGTNNNTCLNACQTGVCGGAFIANCCGNGTLEGTEGCDDGNQSSTDGCTGQCVLELDHFQCYRNRVVQAQPAIPAATLVDQFGTLTADVHRARDLCTPADKNGEDPTAPAHPDHLETYRVVPQHRRLLGQRLPERNVKVVNQFGTLFVDVIWPNRLFVPTPKELEALPPAPANPAVDHFTCYKVKRPKGRSWFTPIPNVTLEDQFGPTTVTLLKPMRLCAPANKNNEEPGAESHIGHLLCYKIRGAFTPVGRVFTNNQFGPGVLYPRFLDELCVPSVKNPN